MALISLAGLISAVGNSLHQERAVTVLEARSGSLCALGPALLSLARAGEGCMGGITDFQIEAIGVALEWTVTRSLLCHLLVR